MSHGKLSQTAVNSLTKASPSVLREIVYGISLGLVGGSFWKMYHVNQRRKVEDFYTALELGEITVEATPS